MFKIYTALVTPFLDNGAIDYLSLDHLLNYLFYVKNTNFVLNGTTGEASALTKKEKKELVTYVLTNYPQGNYIVGINTNCTKDAIEQMNDYQSFDNIEAFMFVVPYYNKPTKTGIEQHFHAIANSTNKDIILYNVPKRTGVTLETDSIIQLISIHPNIIGLKQAGEIGDISLLKSMFPKFKIYLGSDELLEEGLSLGIDGVISVASHVLYQEMMQASNKKDFDFALYKRKCQLLFLESSPSPIKYLLYRKGLILNNLRLPLVPVEKTTEELLNKTFE